MSQSPDQSWDILMCNLLREQMTRPPWFACKHRPSSQFVSSPNPSWSAVIYSLYPNSNRLATADGRALLLSGLKWHYDDLFSAAGVWVCVCVSHLLLGVLTFLWMEMFTFFRLLPYFLQGYELGVLTDIITQLLKISNTVNLIITTFNSTSCQLLQLCTFKSKARLNPAKIKQHQTETTTSAHDPSHLHSLSQRKACAHSCLEGLRWVKPHKMPPHPVSAPILLHKKHQKWTFQPETWHI